MSEDSNVEESDSYFSSESHFEGIDDDNDSERNNNETENKVLEV